MSSKMVHRKSGRNHLHHTFYLLSFFYFLFLLSLHRKSYSSLLKKIFMIIVHDIFVCKPGNASKMAKLFKEVMADNNELVNIMTDMTGQYNRVIMVSKYENLAAYEQSWESYKQNTEAMQKITEKMAGYTDMYLTGSREIYQVW